MTIFNDINSTSSVVIKYDDRLTYIAHTIGYFNMINFMLKDNKISFPILFIVRNAIENILKGTIVYVNDYCNLNHDLKLYLNKKEIDNTHDFSDLIYCLNKLLDCAKFHNLDHTTTFILDENWRNTHLSDIYSWICEFHNIDPKGFEFRFPETSKKKHIGSKADLSINLNEMRQFICVLLAKLIIINVLTIINKNSMTKRDYEFYLKQVNMLFINIDNCIFIDIASKLGYSGSIGKIKAINDRNEMMKEIFPEFGIGDENS